jgi:hypothetical protein
MSGIQQMQMVMDAPDTYLEYSGTVTVGYYVSGSGWPTYGADPDEYGFGAISNEVGGSMDYLFTQSSNPVDFSNPFTSLSIPALGALTYATVTINGITRSGFAGAGSWYYSGDVFALRAKNGQSVSVVIQGTG